MRLCDYDLQHLVHHGETVAIRRDIIMHIPEIGWRACSPGRWADDMSSPLTSPVVGSAENQTHETRITLHHLESWRRSAIGGTPSELPGLSISH